MKLGLLAAWLALGCARPQCPPLPSTPVDPRPFLWDVTGPAGTIHLFGTFHAAGRRDVPRAALARLAAARIFVDEMGAPDPEQIRPYIYFPRGESLPPLLAQDDWFALRDALKDTVREADLRRARPFYAMVLLTQTMVEAPSPAMDQALADEAQVQGKRVEHLETAAEQLGALRDSVTAADLTQAIRDRSRMGCDVAALAAAYRRGDAGAFARDLGAAALDRLLEERNRRWLPHLEAYLQAGGGAFVAVGVSHLVAAQGLPALLEARGFRVARLENPTGP